ncbi:MAG: peptide deformylase [Clostridiales bacterium]|jgi:peptide deformylase|nr:peptide deformylase [Clostridiales bacterium]
MAIRNIMTEENPVLRQKSREVVLFDDRLFELLDDLNDTLHHANGAGIAAPQVGVLRRICLVEVVKGELYELINPVIKRSSGKQVCEEGCLSIPGRSGKVERPKKMTVEAFDRYGKKRSYTVTGYAAVAFSHEIDHLDGVLYVDKLVLDEGEA